MTSLAREIRSNTPNFFMPISSLNGVIFQYNPNAGAVTFSTATWADGWQSTTGGPRGSGPSRYISSINGSGNGILRDIGKQVISAGRVFRKVQLMVRQTGSTSTFGVEGNTSATRQPNVDYLTGYIEFGFDGVGFPTPVAQFGRL